LYELLPEEEQAKPCFAKDERDNLHHTGFLWGHAAWQIIFLLGHKGW
jgi:hypothetical protein